ncbi:MAG: hypothetical protein ACREE3_14020, partial [Stellaceae bacterium]
SERFTEDGVILRTLDEIAAVCRDLNLAYRVDLYSSGDAASFTTFRAHRANLHVNDDVFASFDNLVRADVLMMAKSSFSYVAGMLSEGIKLYEPFWHPPLAPWIVRAPDGGFDRTRLADALIRLRSGGALGD